MCNLIKEIEKKYEVEKITVNKFPIWQVIRINYILELGKSEFQCINTNILNIKDKIVNEVKKLKNCTWQIKNFHKNYEYILFTDVLEERKIEGKISDKIAHNIIQLLGENLLVSLNAIHYEHKSLKFYYHKNYISDRIFSLIKKIKSFKKVNFNIENESILKSIEKEYNVHIEYNKIILDFLCYVDVFNQYLKKHKPKLIFINCYYGVNHQAVIYAAHLNNIKVIELQHGIINEAHYSYNIFKNIGRESFPDYIFTFGDYVEKYISNNFVTKQNIIPVGNYYIEYCKKETLKNNELRKYFSELRNKYAKIVVVTSQITIEEKLINFIKKSAEKSKDILYIFIPRFYEKNFNKYNFPENVLINAKSDFYHTVQFVDFHCTVYSTCALESPSFGTPNILINIDNLSCKYLKKMMALGDICKSVDSTDELVNVIMNWNNVNKNDVVSIGNLFYKSNNNCNIKKALSRIQNNG